jgi:predicted GNAT family N-acyltransferase
MLSIRLAKTEEELQAVYRLRYQVYVEELGATMEYADHQQKALSDEWDKTADIIGAWQNDELVGCVRLNYSHNTDLSEYESFYSKLVNGNSNSISISSKWVVAQAFRRTILSARLSQGCYAQMHVRSAYLNYLTCQTNLVGLYSRMGFRICGASFFHPEAGCLTPMVLVVQDYEYLQQIKSPFANICARYPINQAEASRLRNLTTNHAERLECYGLA